MSDASRFDAFYVEARGRLLVQAFALTGDLPASRGAVRDGFVAAWHHWSKVRRLDDPEAWVRPHVWAHAQRRHTARIWHRDRKLDVDVRATLDALAKLPVVPRKTLLLTQLTTTSRTEMAREVGLPLEEAERRLQTATTQFSLQREVPTTALRPLFDQLSSSCADQRWPRATIVRRAGTARRRTHTTAGAALVVAALVGSGFLVQDGQGVRPTLATARDRIVRVTPAGSGSPTGSPSTSPTATLDTPGTVSASDLLTRAQVGRAVPGRAWRITGTDPGHANSLPCQQGRYADPRPQSALVRNFTARSTRGKPSLAAVQTMEFSVDRGRAKRAFATAGGWFAGCTMDRAQLISVRRVKGLGDEAEQYTLRVWEDPGATLVVGVARTGRATTVAFTRTGGTTRPDLGGNLRLLVSAVDDLCPLDGAGPCSSLPKATVVPVPAAGANPVLLSEFDLPPIAGVQQPWVGTTPRQAFANVAATGCDRSSFHGHGFTRDATRSFVVPAAHLAPAFGLTETVGRLPEPRAVAFVSGIRARLASCSDRLLGTKVLRISGTPALTVWRVRTQVTDKMTVTFYMGIARRGGALAQVGFVADGSHTIAPAAFVALVKRAQARLAEMP